MRLGARLFKNIARRKLGYYWYNTAGSDRAARTYANPPPTRSGPGLETGGSCLIWGMGSPAHKWHGERSWVTELGSGFRADRETWGWNISAKRSK
ncbi:MAG: hypothetical protein CM1200mP15_14580 [Dehalococcoidia bacterium]|nr:MAG: hypothetical protein CM1200mP15_14580 [Dehalococcoidia bacterium]